MPTTGFVLPTWQGADVLTGTTWSNTPAALVNDDTEAIESITAKSIPGTGSLTGGWLKLGNFGFDALIPENAVIQKVELQVRHRMNSAGGVGNREIAWWVDTARGTNIHTNTAEPIVLGDNTYDVTSERAWTREDFFDNVFQVHWRGRNGNNATDPSYRLAWVKVQVTYYIAMTPLVEDSIDTFDRADGTVTAGTGSNIWATNQYDYTSQQARIISNQLGVTAAATARPSLKTYFPADFDMLFDVAVPGTSTGSISFAFGLQGPGTSTWDGYELNVFASPTLSNLYKYVDGVSTLVTPYFTTPQLVAGDSLWLARRGTIVSLWKKASGSSTWTFIVDFNAPDFVAGYNGFKWIQTNWRLDNLRGGPITYGPPPERPDVVTVI